MLADGLAHALGEDRLRLQRRAGLALLQGLVQQRNYLGDLLHQARVLRFESADAIARAAPGEGGPDAERATALLRELSASMPPGPDRADARVRLAARVDAAEAVAICEGLLAAPPPGWDASAAADLLARVDPSRAVPLWTRIVTEWPSSPHAAAAWVGLGDDHFAHARFVEARAAYEAAAALSRHEHDAYANYKLGWTLHALGEHAAGQEKLRVAIESTRDETLRAHATAERERLSGL